MFPMSTSSSTTNRRAFPISSLQLCVHRVQIASGLRIAAHRFNMLCCDLPLERTEPAQAEPMLLCHGANLFDTFPCKVLAQGVILEASFQSQGNRFSHTAISFSWRKTKIKMEINGAWNIDHSSVNH